MALNDILMPPHLGTPSETVEALRSLGRLLALHARGKYVLKAESWNVLFCDLLQEAFPATPWVFCIRDPIDVVISVMDDPEPVVWYRLMGSVENPYRPYLRRSLPESADRGEYISIFYAEFCDAIDRLRGSNGRIICYEQFPHAVWTMIAPHFGLELASADSASVADAAKYYSKSTLGEKTLFLPDTDRKRQRASGEVKQAADEFARPSYERLRSLRAER